MKQYVAAVMGGLLSSSCCVVQLILNAFSFGCVGLKLALEPYRAYFFTLTMMGLVGSFVVDVALPHMERPSAAEESRGCAAGRPGAACRRKPAWRHFLLTAAVVLLLSYSPEILDEMHKNPTPWVATARRALFGGDSASKTCSVSVMLDPDEPKTRIYINITGMHCGACVDKSRNAIHAINSCAHVLLDQTGLGAITVHRDDADAFTDERIETAIKDAKFSVTVMRRESVTDSLGFSYLFSLIMRLVTRASSSLASLRSFLSSFIPLRW